MLSQKLLKFLNISISSQFAIRIQQNFYSSLPLVYNSEKDPAPYFFSPNVQRLLMHLTRPDNTKIFRKRAYHGDKTLENPEYKFLTDAQLQEEFEKVKKRAEKLLEMPPVVKAYEHKDCIISEDPAIKGHVPYRYVFTDISFGLKDKERVCVVREPDGTLRHADHAMRKRLIQTYFPMKGRSLKEPALFTDETLFKDLLERKEYDFVLNKACVQYDPDDVQFQNITSKVYQHCDENSSYEILRSTRHFGPMAFYLSWHNSIDRLLLELLQNGVIRECVSLVSLQRIIHPGMVENDETGPIVDEILQIGKTENSKRLSDQEIELDEKCINCIDNYIGKNSTKKGYQELALQAFRESYKQRVDLERGIRQAHGVN